MGGGVEAKKGEQVGFPEKVIGIGAGAGVDGQVLVTHDMLGINNEFSPRFLRRYAHFYDLMMEAFGNYIKDVKAGTFPNEDECY